MTTCHLTNRCNCRSDRHQVVRRPAAYINSVSDARIFGSAAELGR